MTFQQIGDALPAPLREVNERLQAAREEEFWNKPYLLNEALTGTAVWPADKSLAELLEQCRGFLRIHRTQPNTYRAVELRAAEKTLGRMIDTEAQLHAEGRKTGEAA